MFAGLLLSGLVLVVGTQVVPGGRLAVAETPSGPPDFRALLPADASFYPDAFVTLVSADPSFAVVYSENGSPAIRDISWNRQIGAYAAGDPVRFGVSWTVAPSEVSLASIGKGLPWLISAVAGDGSGLCLALADGDAVRELKLRGPSGFAAPCFIAKDFSLEDVDLDGKAELVVRSRAPTADGCYPVDVFRWDGSGFSYAEVLSWAMTQDRRVFPELAPATNP